MLSELGVGREDRVLMVLDDTPTFPALFLGAMRMGAVPAPVSFLDTTENFAHYARDSYAKLIVAEDALLERLPGGHDGAQRSSRSCCSTHEGLTDPADIHPDDMAFWLFSGGSTGFPKGVVHLHHDIPYTCETFAREILQITEDDVTFSSTKLYHAYGLGNNLTFPYWVGATTVLRPGQAGPARAAGDRAGATARRLFFSVPTLYGAMVNLPDAADHDLSSACASASPPPSRSPPRSTAAGRRRSTSTSSTASARPRCCTSTAPTARATSSPGTSGKPVPGYELVLLDELGQPVADGEVGNLYVRGDSALAYYWHQHEKTKAAIKGDLFFTGDRYRVNDDGDYVYEGRADDMIKIGGLWASPIEIENALVEHPRVLEAAAVGVDADYTTRVKAFVICRGDAGDDALVLELQEWCKSRLRRYEFPHFITFVDELPKTPTGKIQRYKLREEADLHRPARRTAPRSRPR